MKKISIIGGGNLGSAIAEGLIESKFIKPSQLTVTRRNIQALESLQKRGVKVTSDNKAAVTKAEVIILALKPYHVKDFLKEYSVQFKSNPIIISAVTGFSITEMKDIVGSNLAIVRVMPNTAIAIRQSMTCICHENASDEQVSYVNALFETLGKVAFVEEKLMDAATVLGACGTAFAMRYIRANIQGGIEIGFTADTATKIAIQTIKGAAELLLSNNTHPEAEIDKVTTPKGCTITGLNTMEHHGFSSSVIRGIISSFDKIQ